MDEVIAWATLSTLCYAAVFSYPLSESEIARYLISKKKVSKRKIRESLDHLLKMKIIRASPDGEWFMLASVTGYADRKARRRLSKKKLRRMKRGLDVLSRLPTVELIGISGAVARENATVRDDLDLFIITKPQTLWLTRLLVTITLEFLGVRRKPLDARVSSTICANMFIDTTHLAIPFAERDLFSAFEVVQMRPVFVRDTVYQKFLWENRWVREFLGDSRIMGYELGVIDFKKRLRSYFSFLTSIFLIPLEFLAKSLQLWYMKKRKTTEVITDGYVRFHPDDARAWVMRKYRWRCAQVMRQLTTVKTSSVSHLPLFAGVQEAPSPRG